MVEGVSERDKDDNLSELMEKPAVAQVLVPETMTKAVTEKIFEDPSHLHVNAFTITGQIEHRPPLVCFNGIPSSKA